MRGDITLYCVQVSAGRPAVISEASSGSLHSLQANVGRVPQIWTRQFPFTHIRIHYS
jgi:hypothetical protein